MSEHGQLMDKVYRRMKYVYDISRPFFLAGRAHARSEVLSAGYENVCEVGCGTGLNLILMQRDQLGAGTKFTGLDVSTEMVNFAREKVQASAYRDAIDIRLQDFSDFLTTNPKNTTYLFSYSLSMIPNWEDMLRQAAKACLNHGGAIVIVDFSTMESWPFWIRERLRKNLIHFHVYPRYDLEQFCRTEPLFKTAQIVRTPKFGGYAAVLTVTFHDSPSH